MFWHWLIHTSGVDYGVRYGHWVWYNFWSGSGSDVQELAILGAVYGVYRKHNCHAQPCWRLGLFPALEGKGWHYCRKHHRDGGIHK